jgi:hypothetical protein
MILIMDYDYSGLRLSSTILKNTTFQKLDVFLFSGKGMGYIGPIESHWIYCNYLLRKKIHQLFTFRFPPSRQPTPIQYPSHIDPFAVSCHT